MLVATRKHVSMLRGRRSLERKEPWRGKMGWGSVHKGWSLDGSDISFTGKRGKDCHQYAGKWAYQVRLDKVESSVVNIT